MYFAALRRGPIASCSAVLAVRKYCCGYVSELGACLPGVRTGSRYKYKNILYVLGHGDLGEI